MDIMTVSYDDLLYEEIKFILLRSPAAGDNIIKNWAIITLQGAMMLNIKTAGNQKVGPGFLRFLLIFKG